MTRPLRSVPTSRAYDPTWNAPSLTPCPYCLHLGMMHDIETIEDPLPSCCVDGCDCGPDQAKR